jgi:hypothetical protein
VSRIDVCSLAPVAIVQVSIIQSNAGYGTLVTARLKLLNNLPKPSASMQQVKSSTFLLAAD